VCQRPNNAFYHQRKSSVRPRPARGHSTLLTKLIFIFPSPLRARRTPAPPTWANALRCETHGPHMLSRRTDSRRPCPAVRRIRRKASESRRVATPSLRTASKASRWPRARVCRTATNPGHTGPSHPLTPLHVAEGRAKQRAILAAELDKEGSGFKSAKSASQRKNAKKIMFAH
jgi:hypothetical protein